MAHAVDGRQYGVGVIEHFWCAPYGADCRSLRAHRARPAQYRIGAARALRAIGELAGRIGAPRVSATHRSNWSATGCRAFRRCWPPRRADAELARAIAPAARVAVYPNAIPLVPLPPAGGVRPSSSPATWNTTPTAPPCGSSAARSGPGCASAGPIWSGGWWGKIAAAVRPFTAGDPRIEVSGAGGGRRAGTGARAGGGGAASGRQRNPAQDSGGLGRRTRRGFHHDRRGRPAGTRRRDILLADGPAAFADAVSRLLACRELRRQIGQSWQAVAGKRVYMGNSLEKSGFLTQPWVIMVRYTGTVNAFCR